MKNENDVGDSAECLVEIREVVDTVKMYLACAPNAEFDRENVESLVKRLDDILNTLPVGTEVQRSVEGMVETNGGSQ